MSIEFLIDEKLSDKRKANKKLGKIIKTVTRKPKSIEFDLNKAIFLKKFILALNQAGKGLHNKQLAEDKLLELKQQQELQLNKLEELRQKHIETIENIPEKIDLEEPPERESEESLNIPSPIRFDRISDVKAKIFDNLESGNKVLEHKPFKLDINKEALQEALASIKQDKDFLRVHPKKH